jgi:hypothetical protein
MLKTYRKKCKQEHKKFKINLLDALDQLSSSNPKEYWNLVNKITGKAKTNCSVIEPESLFEHYNKLNNPQPHTSSAREETLKELNSLERFPLSTSLTQIMH